MIADADMTSAQASAQDSRIANHRPNEIADICRFTTCHHDGDAIRRKTFNQIRITVDDGGQARAVDAMRIPTYRIDR